MAFVTSELIKQSADNTAFSDQLLAVISLHLKVEKQFPAKITATATVKAKWNLTYKNEVYPLDKIILEIGYADSTGIPAFKNSAMIIGNVNAGSLAPLIWTETIQHQVLEAKFLKNDSNVVLVKYKALFKLSAQLPKGFNDMFSGSETLHIDEAEQDFSIKILLH